MFRHALTVTGAVACTVTTLLACTASLPAAADSSVTAGIQLQTWLYPGSALRLPVHRAERVRRRQGEGRRAQPRVLDDRRQRIGHPGDHRRRLVQHLQRRQRRRPQGTLRVPVPDALGHDHRHRSRPGQEQERPHGGRHQGHLARQQRRAQRCGRRHGGLLVLERRRLHQLQDLPRPARHRPACQRQAPAGRRAA